MSFNIAQQQYEAKKKAAMLHSGYKHILLILLNHGRINLGGIDVLEATPVSDPTNRTKKWDFKINGGAARFEVDDNYGGDFVFHMLDTKRNRMLLATHLSGNYWRIHDKEIKKEIKSLLIKMEKENVTPEQPSEFVEKTNKLKELYEELQIADERDQAGIQLKMTRLSEELGNFDGKVSPSEKLPIVRKQMQKPISNPQKAQKAKQEMRKLTKETSGVVNVE